MTSFLSELASKLADKWVSMLVAPGLLYLAVAVAGGHVLTQQHWHDTGRLYGWVTHLAGSTVWHSDVVLAALLVAVLAGAGAAGLAASGLGAAVGWLWLGRWGWPGWLLERPLTTWRRWRWGNVAARYLQNSALLTQRQADRADGLLVQGPDPDLPSLAAERNRISLEPPARPTWIGDRLLAVDARVFRAYHLDLSFGWSRLWSTLPDPARSDLTAAQSAYSSSARLTAWGLLYLALGGWWWPSAPVGAVVVLAGWWRGRHAAAAYGELLESVVDLHAKDMATALGFPVNGPFTAALGEAVTVLVRKGA